LGDKNEARGQCGRRFQEYGPITEKDLDMAMVVLPCPRDKELPPVQGA